MSKLLLLLAFCFITFFVYAQTPEPDYVLHIKRTEQPVRLDGVLDEPVWQTAEPARDFTVNFPVDTGLAQKRTEVKVGFDDRFLYVSAVCTQEMSSYTVQSLKRDFPNGVSDVFNVLINPSKDGLNGFFFSLSPLNVQREALIDNGGNLSFEWDNKWYSAVKNSATEWVLEMAIPFNSLRYTLAETGQNTWRINFVRAQIKPTEISTWYPVKQPFSPNNLAFTGQIQWLSAPPKARTPVAVIPFATAAYGINYRRDDNSLALYKKEDDWNTGLGGDAKIGITPSLNLDLTLYPDFSQVEVDRQVANLSRFELFFPERRQFFLENRDLFAMFGFPSSRPFFSRRIGITRNPLTGQNERVPIIAGARLSGKLTDKWRVGLLNMQTERVVWDSMNALPATNFTVATVQRQVFERSALSGILVNQQNILNPLNENQQDGLQPWNRIAGLEYNLYSKDNKWEGETYYHRSFSPDKKQCGQTAAHFMSFTERNFNIYGGYVLIDSQYTAPVGFVPRNGFQNLIPGVGWTFYFPSHPKFNTLNVGLEGDLIYDLRFKATDREVNLYGALGMKDQSSFVLGLSNSYTFLFEDFDPTNQLEPSELPLPGQKGYTYWSAFGEWNSSPVHDFQGFLSASAGQFFNGNLVNLDGGFSFRFQPYGTFTINYSYNRIRLPKPYASADFWIVGPQAELSFSRNLFASAFFQYNTQVNNFNINARLQWRFAPVSDVFLVYTDNSFAEAIPNSPVRFFSPKNKAIVLKVVYWVNI